jgi:hypothetical protein
MLGVVYEGNFLNGGNSREKLRDSFICNPGAMEMASSPNSAEMIDLSASDKEAVLRQVERLLESTQFRNSRRYPDLLRYVVEQTLAGKAETLKERVLGIEVFGREPGFDTSGDSIVRVAAAEVRKRIAQYYQEEGHGGELRVDLPPGSYVARFRWPAAVSTPAVAPKVQDPVAEPGRPEEPAIEIKAIPPARRGKARWVAGSIGVAAILLIAIAAWNSLRDRGESGLERFWGPILKPAPAVLVCFAAVDLTEVGPNMHAGFTAQAAAAVNAAANAPIFEGKPGVFPAIAWTEAAQLASLAEMLGKSDKKFVLRNSRSATLADLRNGPVILGGLLGNSWSMRFVSKLRFHPHMDVASQRMWIEDAEHPERTDWGVPWGQAYSDSYDNYALITRSKDALSGQYTVEIGGLGLHGDQAAGEFVTNPLEMNALSNDLRDPNRNVQIVLKVEVVNGAAGPPQILAIHYW